MRNIVTTLYFSFQPREDKKGEQYQAVYYDGNCQCVVIPDRDSAHMMTEDGFWKVTLARPVYTAPSGFFRILAAHVREKGQGVERAVDFRWLCGNQWIATEEVNGITTRFVVKHYDQPRIAMPYLRTPDHVAVWRVKATEVAWSSPKDRVVRVELLEDVTPQPKPVEVKTVTQGPAFSTPTHRGFVPRSVLVARSADKVDKILTGLRLPPLSVPRRPTSRNQRRIKHR